MTQEEFIEILKEKDYSYEIQGDKIVVTHKRYVYLNSLTSIPPGVKFKNEGSVGLNSLTSLPPDVEFRNKGDVWLQSLTSLPPDVEFRNKGHVFLNSLTSISIGVKFMNGGDVNLDSLIGGWFSDWNGNIDGIDNNVLLNGMIKRGVFI
jgi:hypothetical protein